MFQKGSSIVLWTKTNTNAILGADAIGEIGKSSETIGNEVAKSLLNEIISKHTGQDIEKVEKDTERDFILDAKESKDYGIVDEVIYKK